MVTILLARHGQASFGQSNYDKLSNLGIKQAKLLGQHYAGTQRRIDAVFSGSLMRQQDSARYFWQQYQASLVADATKPPSVIFDTDNIDKHILPEFNEFNHQDVFIKSNPTFTTQAAIAEEIAKSAVPKLRLGELFDQAMQRWHSGDYDEDYLESWPQFNERAQQALAQIKNRVAQASHLDDDSTVIVFTSGGVIAAISAHLLQQGSQTAYQLNRGLINTGVTAITFHEQASRLLSLNEYSHLFAEGERFVTWR